MLTEQQLQLLKQIHAGELAGNAPGTEDLLERGLVAREQGNLEVTPQGRDALGLREGLGDAIVDAILPGEGARQAEEHGTGAPAVGASAPATGAHAAGQPKGE
ncbi:hypothetical protein [Bordetella genomosp. 11]|nr:hypothetical protein [Bordetella genomosp. 11]